MPSATHLGLTAQPVAWLPFFFPPTSAQKVVRTWTGSEKRIEKTYVTVYVPLLESKWELLYQHFACFHCGHRMLALR